jgi:transposase
MIEADKRKAIFLLHQEGMPLREIARRLRVSRNTVAVVIAQGGQLPKLVRPPKHHIDAQLLQRLYEQCGGWIQRVHEKLAEEEGIAVKYSTLTRLLRHLGISQSPQGRCRLQLIRSAAQLGPDFAFDSFSKQPLFQSNRSASAWLLYGR